MENNEIRIWTDEELDGLCDACGNTIEGYDARVSHLAKSCQILIQDYKKLRDYEPKRNSESEKHCLNCGSTSIKPSSMAPGLFTCNICGRQT